MIPAAAALLGWLGLALHPARPWDLQPVAEREPPSPSPDRWPSVAVLVPAHDEAALLPETLPALLTQDYPGPWGVVLVDDRSADGTGRVARALGPEITVVDGAPLPDGWVGKVWALAQGLEHAGAAEYLLLTDADIHHVPGSLARLVAESEHADLVLNSRMALLRTDTAAERFLIPAFAFFFACLYPMRWVNTQRRRFAAAAGGCILVRRDALVAAGGFTAIRGEIIDDVNLARLVAPAGSIRLSASRSGVRSRRAYRRLGPIWRMVRRTAFDQLRYSWLMLSVTVVLLLVLFAAPPASTVHAVVTGAWPEAAVAGAAWLLSMGLYVPAVRHFSLHPGWACALPLAGLLYGAMTVDSAVQHVRGRGQRW